MTWTKMPRRNLLETGACAQKDLGTLNMLLADNFTFMSATGDDHISKSTFKAQRWDTQVDFIGNRSGMWSTSASRTDGRNLLSVIAAHNPAFRQQ